MVYRAFFDAVFRSMDPEKAHERGFAAIRAGRFGTRLVFPQTYAPRTVMGIEFPNAFGLAAGFDKNAKAVPGAAGAGLRPRRDRHGDRRGRSPATRGRACSASSTIARSSTGWASTTTAPPRWPRGCTGSRHQAGRTRSSASTSARPRSSSPSDAVADYVESARLLAPYAELPRRQRLLAQHPGPARPAGRRRAAAAAHRRQGGRATARRPRRVPLLVKIAPDLADADVDAVADLALELGLDGISATNTTIARPESLKTSRDVIDAAGAGGLSGPILAERATEVLVRLRARVGDRLAHHRASAESRLPTTYARDWPPEPTWSRATPASSTRARSGRRDSLLLQPEAVPPPISSRGSSPCIFGCRLAPLAQSAERFHGKEKVYGSIP